MKRIICFLFASVIFTSTAFSYPYYYFDKKKIKTSKSNFKRYVRPQINNIIKEYYHILTKIEPLQGELISIKKQIQTLNRDWPLLSDICSEDIDKCKVKLKRFYLLSRRLDSNILKIQKSKFSFLTEKKDKSKELDNILRLSKHLDEISLLSYKNLHFLEEVRVNSDPEGLKHKLTKYSQTLHLMLLSSEMTITILLDNYFGPLFESVWAGYIKKIESHVLIERNQDYLLSKLEHLNTSWNAFHMKIVRGNISLPKKLTNVVVLMHNRWNSILKLYLKHTDFLDKETIKKMTKQF